jgi:hypothetical protein
LKIVAPHWTITDSRKVEAKRGETNVREGARNLYVNASWPNSVDNSGIQQDYSGPM